MEELFEMQRIYHRCIFDAFNEIFYSLANNSANFNFTLIEQRTIQSSHISESSLNFYLMKTKLILLEYTMLLCGLIKDKEDSMLGNSLKKFDLDSLNSIREERLIKLVSGEFKEKK